MHSPANDTPAALTRVQLLGHLAAACRLALMEVEQADAVELSVTASVNGLEVDCTVMVAGVPVSGWGQ
jgi:hypothetical protein